MNTTEKSYLLDLGVFLPETDADYNCYNIVYDKKRSYFDELQLVYRKKEFTEALKTAKEYVKIGVANTYAVITEQSLYIKEVESADYSVDAVVYCCYKDNTGTIIENFIK